MFTVMSWPPSPAPMLLGVFAPFVAVTLVTPLVMVMVPQTPLVLPPPMPAAFSPPVASTVPPLMVMLPQEP